MTSWQKAAQNEWTQCHQPPGKFLVRRLAGHLAGAGRYFSPAVGHDRKSLTGCSFPLMTSCAQWLTKERWDILSASHLSGWCGIFIGVLMYLSRTSVITHTRTAHFWERFYILFGVVFPIVWSIWRSSMTKTNKLKGLSDFFPKFWVSRWKR